MTLALFETLVDLNCEDVMLELVLRHLVPCSHVMLSQRSRVRYVDPYCRSADKLLSLVPEIPRSVSTPGALTRRSRVYTCTHMPDSSLLCHSAPEVSDTVFTCTIVLTMFSLYVGLIFIKLNLLIQTK